MQGARLFRRVGTLTVAFGLSLCAGSTRACLVDGRPAVLGLLHDQRVAQADVAPEVHQVVPQQQQARLVVRRPPAAAAVVCGPCVSLRFIFRVLEIRVWGFREDPQTPASEPHACWEHAAGLAAPGPHAMRGSHSLGPAEVMAALGCPYRAAWLLERRAVHLPQVTNGEVRQEKVGELRTVAVGSGAARPGPGAAVAVRIRAIGRVCLVRPGRAGTPARPCRLCPSGPAPSQPARPHACLPFHPPVMGHTTPQQSCRGLLSAQKWTPDMLKVRSHKDQQHCTG